MSNMLDPAVAGAHETAAIVVAAIRYGCKCGHKASEGNKIYVIANDSLPTKHPDYFRVVCQGCQP